MLYNDIHSNSFYDLVRKIKFFKKELTNKIILLANSLYVLSFVKGIPDFFFSLFFFLIERICSHYLL